MHTARLNLLHYNSYYKYCYCKLSTQILSDFPNIFNYADSPNKWHQIWEKNNYFTVKDSQKETLSMILPPPNITGTLHLGHALTVTVQDVLARWYRMKGHPVVWIPGFDHAGIATQLMVEKYLSKVKGVSKSEIGKEEFVSLVWQWKSDKETTIKSQLKTLGASLDWPREYFTMSKDHNKAVVEAFVVLSDRNLLYRKKDIVNWSPALRTAISEIEVERLHIKKKIELEVPGYEKKITFGEIAHIAYPIKDSKQEIIVTTTRPETVFGDVAIAVHPDDERYTEYIGKQVWHTLRQNYIPIISDPLVDKQFGTGAVKVTPAHDELDFRIATNHKLDIIDVIDEDGKITTAGKQFEGLPRFIAREKVLNELSNKGVLRNVSEHEMSIPICSRSRDIVECMLKEQWFITCKNMADKAVKAVEQGHLNIIPDTRKEIWYDYLNNIRDWCISRQTWWGHSIPAYYITVGDKIEWIVARTENDAHIIAQKKYGPDIHIHKDSDVLDTWFSSAILPFSVLGWPKETEDFKKYFPLTLMETGYDILFFWVARMVMLSLELTDQLPFHEVLLHGLLCDAYGKKMSKTVGNVVAPENIINGITLTDLAKQVTENYNKGIINKTILHRMLNANKKMFPNGIPMCGADALRMALCSHNIKNNNFNFDIAECQTNKFFANKIWQVGKYVLLMTAEKKYQEPKDMTIIDRWILSRLSLMVYIVNKTLLQREFQKAVTAFRQFLYYEFCDFYLEATKWGFKNKDMNIDISHTYCLRTCLEVFLRAFAPIMPYLTDDLYNRLSSKLPEFLSVLSLMEAPYPMPEQFDKWRDVTLDTKMEVVLRIIEEIRSCMGTINKKMNPEVHIVTNESEDLNFYSNTINLIKAGSKVLNISVFAENNYIKKECSICHPCNFNDTLFIIAQDPAALKQIKENISNKKKISSRKESQKCKQSV